MPDPKVSLPAPGVKPLGYTKTQWMRLLSSSEAANTDVALKNPIQDPLWMLARQYHSREFQAQDCGFPVWATAEIETLPLTGVGTLGATSFSAYDPEEAPLEYLFEAELPEKDIFLSMRLESVFLSHLGGNQAANRALLRSTYPFAPDLSADPKVDDPSIDTPQKFNTALGYWAEPELIRLHDAGFADVTDMDRIFVQYAVPSSSTAQTIATLLGAGVTAAQVSSALDEALKVHPHTDQIKQAAALGWQKKDLEYGFSVRAHGSANTDMRLDAAHAGRSHLDWYSFNIRSVSNPQPLGQETTQQFGRVPTQFYFAGLPAPRWWELEERVQNYYDSLGTGDLTAIITRQVVNNFSSDWFLLPITLQQGNLARVSRLSVKDHFGRTFSIKPAVSPDFVNPLSLTYSLFHTSNKDATYTPQSPWMMLTPGVQFYQQSSPVEQVSLMPDEMANMTWGAELIVPSVLGGGRKGAELADAVRSYLNKHFPDVTAPNPSPLELRLATGTPENWIPLLLEQYESEMVLRRGVSLRDMSGLAETKDEKFLAITPRTVLLRQDPNIAPYQPLRFSQTAVAAEGTTVTAVVKRARWYDGQTHVWMARKTSYGKVAANSGLTFDNLKRNKT